MGLLNYSTLLLLVPLTRFMPFSKSNRNKMLFSLRFLEGVCFVARWGKVTVAVAEETQAGVERQRLAMDTDILTLEQPGRVTG